MKISFFSELLQSIEIFVYTIQYTVRKTFKILRTCVAYQLRVFEGHNTDFLVGNRDTRWE